MSRFKFGGRFGIVVLGVVGLAIVFLLGTALARHYGNADKVVASISFLSAAFWFWAAVMTADTSPTFRFGGIVISQDRALNGVAAALAGAAMLAQMSVH